MHLTAVSWARLLHAQIRFDILSSQHIDWTQTKYTLKWCAAWKFYLNWYNLATFKTLSPPFYGLNVAIVAIVYVLRVYMCVCACACLLRGAHIQQLSFTINFKRYVSFRSTNIARQHTSMYEFLLLLSMLHMCIDRCVWRCQCLCESMSVSNASNWCHCNLFHFFFLQIHYVHTHRHARARPHAHIQR